MNKKTNYTIREMTKEELRRMQLIQLELLQEVDRICTKHHISYSVEGGTLLGAVRHGGFIPWDDDVDIAMVRSEYRKFCKVCKKELDSEKYFFQNHDTDPEYRWGYAKVLKNGTSFVRYGQEHLKMRRGVYVEIFPMDGIPEGPIEKKFYNFLRVCCRKVMWSEVGKISCKSIGMRLWFGMVNRIPVDKAFAMLEFLSKKYDERRARYVTCLSFPDCWVKGEPGFKREYYLNTKRMLFEGEEINVPQKETELLVTLYGNDYMTPPPEKERGTHIPVSDFKF
ncbi:MAG: LicD family protein [Hungatella sp.]|jgi:lipopolysaccharide cholinephosphotransferase|nr:LicD family protein [Hungatella sp.]